MLAIRCVETLDGFEKLQNEWNALADQTSIFQTWEWSWSWWLRYGRGRRLYIVCVYENECLVGVAPLFISGYYGLPLKIAGFIGAGCSDYGDILVRWANPEPVIDAILGHLSKDNRWDAIDLQQLSPGSAGLGLEPGLPEQPVFRLEQDQCFSVSLPSSYDEFLGRLSKKFRWNVRYYRRRLERESDVVFRRASNVETIGSDIKLFFALHQRRFINKKKLGRFLSPRFVAFHAEVAERLLRLGRLGLFFLEVDGRAVAALYGFELENRFYYYLSGFEPAWGRSSVSTVLLSRVFENCIERGIEHFDFLRGPEPYKLKWGATGRVNSRLVIGRPTIRSEIACHLIRKENDLVVKVKAREAEA